MDEQELLQASQRAEAMAAETQAQLDQLMDLVADLRERVTVLEP